MKKLLSIILVAILACTALASCNVIEEKDANAGAGALTYISLRINPEIEMVADENGIIVSANAINTDGEVVLSTTELEGKNIEDATVAFTETAVDLGFMDPAKGTDTVYVDINGENTEVKEKVEKTVSEKLAKFFETKGLKGKVSKEVLDTYIESADEWNVSPEHAKLITRTLLANPELTYDELLNLTVKDLLDLLKADKHEDKISANVKDEYKEKIDDIKDEYEDLFEIRKDIDELENKLKNENLTAEEKAAIESELAEKQEELKKLDTEYKNEVKKVKNEYKDLSKSAREECRKEANDRKEAKKNGKDYTNKVETEESVTEEVATEEIATEDVATEETIVDETVVDAATEEVDDDESEIDEDDDEDEDDDDEDED